MHCCRAASDDKSHHRVYVCEALMSEAMPHIRALHVREREFLRFRTNKKRKETIPFFHQELTRAAHKRVSPVWGQRDVTEERGGGAGAHTESKGAGLRGKLVHARGWRKIDEGVTAQ